MADLIQYYGTGTAQVEHRSRRVFCAPAAATSRSISKDVDVYFVTRSSSALRHDDRSAFQDIGETFDVHHDRQGRRRHGAGGRSQARHRARPAWSSTRSCARPSRPKAWSPATRVVKERKKYGQKGARASASSSRSDKTKLLSKTGCWLWFSLLAADPEPHSSHRSVRSDSITLRRTLIRGQESNLPSGSGPQGPRGINPDQPPSVPIPTASGPAFKQEPHMANITMKELLEAGVHFGHQTKRWNPKMKEYIFGERNGIYIIDLQKTLKMFKEASKFVTDLTSTGKLILFVGTKRQAQDADRRRGQRAPACPTSIARWLGGLLTNWVTVQKSVKRLQELDDMSTDGRYELLTKKEVIKLERERKGLSDKSIGHQER